MSVDLKFLKTFSVNEFKQKMGVDKLEIKKNPQTGKCFFVYGVETGKVSNRFEGGGINQPVISEVLSAETGETFYMIHERGEGGAETLATL
mgnify:CR=1 FL=1